MTADALRELLACPRCDAPLADSGAVWRCAGCDVDFPHVAGIPWLFAEPNAALDEWRARLHFSLQKLERERQQIAAALASTSLRPATRARLDGLERATRDHDVRLRALLAPVELEQHSASYETYLALRTRLPPDQGLTTYYANIHRDWCWGDTENDASFEALAAALRDVPPRRALVLGAGAGRLAYDLHSGQRPPSRSRSISIRYFRSSQTPSRAAERSSCTSFRSRHAQTQPCCERSRRLRRRARGSPSCSPTCIGRRSGAARSTRS